MATMATCLGGNHVQSQDKPLRNHPTSSLTSRVGANIVNIVSHARPRRWRGNWWNNETWFCSDFKIALILINCVVTLISASGKCDTQQTQLFPEKLFQKHSSLFCWHSRPILNSMKKEGTFRSYLRSPHPPNYLLPSELCILSDTGSF